MRFNTKIIRLDDFETRAVTSSDFLRHAKAVLRLVIRHGLIVITYRSKPLVGVLDRSEFPSADSSRPIEVAAAKIPKRVVLLSMREAPRRRRAPDKALSKTADRMEAATEKIVKRLKREMKSNPVYSRANGKVTLAELVNHILMMAKVAKSPPARLVFREPATHEKRRSGARK